MSAISSARNYNYQDVPLVERAFGLGLASMALDSDTGVMYYNPAVLARVDHSQLSTAVSAWSRIDTRSGDFVSIFRSAKDNLRRTGFLAIPSMVGGHIRTGEWTWGGTILIPQSFANSGSVAPDANFVTAFDAREDAFWYGFFVARAIDEKHSFGVSLFYLSLSENEKFTYVRHTGVANDGTNLFNARFVEQTLGASALLLIFGGTYKVNDAVTLGYSFRTPAVKLSGDASYTDVDTDGTTGSTVFAGKTKFYPLPMRFSVGVGWQASPAWTFAADAHYYTPYGGNLGGSNLPVFEVRAQGIPNFSVGAEYMRWKSIGVRAGLFTNLSSARDVPTGLTAINDRVHMFGSTASVVFSKKEGSISIGGYIQGGQGRAPDIVNGPTIALPRSNYIYGAVLGSSYKFN